MGFDNTQVWCAFPQGPDTREPNHTRLWKGGRGWTGPTLASIASVKYDVCRTIFELQYSTTPESWSGWATLSQNAEGGVSVTEAAIRSFLTIPNYGPNTVTFCEVIGVTQAVLKPWLWDVSAKTLHSVNNRLHNYTQVNLLSARGCYGVILLDFAEFPADLVSLIVCLNIGITP